MTTAPVFQSLDTFARRHLGSGPEDTRAMLDAIGVPSLDALVERTVPASIRFDRALDLPAARAESVLLDELRAIADRNVVARSFIGAGYHGTLTPGVILRNIMENPGWYTQYTPYQAEIAQGRLEALLNYQTMVAELTGLPISNASLLDEGTAAAEAMTICRAAARGKRATYFVADDVHPQTLAVVRTRANPLGIRVLTGDPELVDFDTQDVFAVLVQYPATDGRIRDFEALAERAHAAGAMLVVAADILALTLLRAPGEFGADIAVGSTQRFGVPMGFGGPHAAYMAVRDDLKRLMPGRLIGVSRDADGNPAYRLALQTREQHIRRDKATSNICTAQVLLAIMASMYAVYHGPDGLRAIATRVRHLTHLLADALRDAGFRVTEGPLFDTFRVEAPGRADALRAAARARGINLRDLGPDALGVSLDETTSRNDLVDLFAVFGLGDDLDARAAHPLPELPGAVRRTSDFLTPAVFRSYHTEHELLRYIHRLQARDLSLVHSMIPLGSCTMKLNATSEMIPVTWPAFGAIHPFAPADQTEGYRTLFRQLEAWLAEITGFAATSLQPNAGSQGEYAGLLVIRAWHERNGNAHRNVCLIPVSAHGTNPASAVIAGFRVVPVACDDRGNIDLADLRARVEAHKHELGALMVTYPSTHGVFEEDIREICEVVHAAGGQVYLDGANMNAQVGLCRPGDFGADVCHLNLHKTFCIPHGGGGPGMGPICVAPHLVPFLPGHPLTPPDHTSEGPVAAAAWGSASILPISWMYIGMMGPDGLRDATRYAILNANYMAARLAPHFRILYTGRDGFVAHEFVVDLRPFKLAAGIEPEDVAKRLMDYGFHAPTMSWPVPGTLMIEPTESESRAELDRFCDAMIRIRQEIQDIIDGNAHRDNNPLRRAPHTAAAVMSDNWDRPYTREQAAFPAPWVRAAKFWPHVARVDNAWGDRNLVCTCAPMSDYAAAKEG